MITARTFIAALFSAGLIACSAPETTNSSEATPSSELHEKLVDVAADTYSLEKTHAFLYFKIPHGYGLSNYRIAFTDFDASLDFDPANPESATLDVTINPMGIATTYPGYYKASHQDSPYETWNEDISRNPKSLNADVHPEISFTATGISRTGDDTGTVTGDLTLLGVTKPVTLDATYNGVTNVSWFGERDILGFDATATFKRSDFGMTDYAPIIGDEVTVTFSGEFLQDE